MTEKTDQLRCILLQEQCSLVVAPVEGNLATFNKRGVRDLVWLLDNDPGMLRGAAIADKVVGKAAAGLIVCGGVAEVYAEVMSRLALPLLQRAGVIYSFGSLVDRIVIPAGDSRCPLEQIVAEASTATEVESLLRRHFSEMQSAVKNK